MIDGLTASDLLEDATIEPNAWHCDTHGTIHDAKSRSWDNGDADPLHSTMWEAYCPQCGIECLTVEEWAEEQAIDAEIEKDARPRPRRYAFDGATKLLNINEDRQEFHHWCGKMVNLGKAHTKDEWQGHLDTFRQSEKLNLAWSMREMEQQAKDAADLINMQADALGTLY